MILDALHRIANHRQSLSREEAHAVMTEVLTGQCSDAQIAALLVALHMKGETVEEIVGFAEAIRAAAIPLELHSNSVLDASGTGRDALVDTCGTGGDASGTFNISTATAFVVAGAGVRVAKHGNRSVTSKCGSADVMEALGVNINLPTAQIAACLEQVGIAFLFAPAMHSAMKYVQNARRELHLRTVFNLLGPLTNPARANCQVVGVYSADLVEKLSEALSMLGLHRALVVHGSDGLDEITITGPTRVGEVREGQVHTYEVTPGAHLRSHAGRVRIAESNTRRNLRRRRLAQRQLDPPSLSREKIGSPRRSVAQRCRRPRSRRVRRSSARCGSAGGEGDRLRHSPRKAGSAHRFHHGPHATPT